ESRCGLEDPERPRRPDRQEKAAVLERLAGRHPGLEPDAGAEHRRARRVQLRPEEHVVEHQAGAGHHHAGAEHAAEGLGHRHHGAVAVGGGEVGRVLLHEVRGVAGQDLPRQALGAPPLASGHPGPRRVDEGPPLGRAGGRGGGRRARGGPWGGPQATGSAEGSFTASMRWWRYSAELWPKPRRSKPSRSWSVWRIGKEYVGTATSKPRNRAAIGAPQVGPYPARSASVRTPPSSCTARAIARARGPR